MNLKATVIAFAISALTIAPALAQSISTISNVRPRPAVGTPGPVAGVGLAFLVVGGGYLVFQYRRRRAKQTT